MQPRSLLPALALFCVVSNVHAQNSNTLTAEESQQGFVALFNGSDLSGWQHKGNWKVEDGVIAREGRGGSLVYETTRVPDDFELRFEWKVAEGSNSGIYYRPTQNEYQILDNAKHKDGLNPRTSAASVYFCMAPSHDATRPVGEWNTGRVVCKGTIVQHWMNGEKVIHLDYADPKWAWNVSMLNNRGGDLTARGANLSLQDHGDPVWYRAIRWRALSADDEIDMTPVTPQPLTDAQLAAEQRKLAGIMERSAKARQRRAKTGK